MGLFLSIDVLLFNLRPSRGSPVGSRLPDVSCVLIFKLFTLEKFKKKINNYFNLLMKQSFGTKPSMESL